MSVTYNNLDIETIFRPNYEFNQCLWLFSGAAFYAAMAILHIMPAGPLWWICGIFTLLGLTKLGPCLKLHKMQKALVGRELYCCTLDELKTIGLSQVHADDMWLGRGFRWETRHTQRVYEMMKLDWTTLVREFGKTQDRIKFLKALFTLKGLLHPLKLRNDIKEAEKRVTQDMGHSWIHGVEAKEDDIWQKMRHVEGHTLIVGTTGSGKTRMFDLLISQAILRGEPVIIIDPKGDKELCENAKRACEALDRAKSFVVFDPAHPRQSIRINPLANWTVATELASRILSMVPGKDDAFKAFSWDAVNKIVQGMVICLDRPTLKGIRSRIESGGPSLVCRSLMSWGVRCLGEKSAQEAFSNMHITASSDLNSDKLAKLLISWYRNHLQRDHGSSEIEGLISLYEHDATHFSKMISSLIPALAKVTTGELGSLLSPGTEKESANFEYRNFKELIANNCVVYVALSAMRDSEVASAIGSMMLADITAVAGSRYAYDEKHKPVNIFADEASEVANDPMIQMLNKGRGAGFRLFIATQTFADFSVRLGSKDKADQVLSNLNNIFALRTTNAQTQEMLTKSMPEVKVKYIMRDQGQSIDADEPLMNSGSLGERLMEEKSQLIPPAIFGMLPNLEYIASVSGGHYIKGRIPILVRDKSEFRRG